MAYALLGVSLSLQSLDELCAKYTEMVAMRLEHANGTENRVDVRSRMAALSRRFPGALRELDRLEMVELRGRLTQLQAARAGEGRVEPWMAAVALFHALTRGALSAKRWLRGQTRVGEVRRHAFLADLPNVAFPDDARAWHTELDALATPPTGRLTDLVYIRIARSLGVSPDEARSLVFAGDVLGRRPP